MIRDISVDDTIQYLYILIQYHYKNRVRTTCHTWWLSPSVVLIVVFVFVVFDDPGFEAVFWMNCWGLTTKFSGISTFLAGWI